MLIISYNDHVCFGKTKAFRSSNFKENMEVDYTMNSQYQNTFTLEYISEI